MRSRIGRKRHFLVSWADGRCAWALMGGEIVRYFTLPSPILELRKGHPDRFFLVLEDC